MSIQDEKGEILASRIILTDKWLNDLKIYHAKRKHPKMLGLLGKEVEKGILLLDGGCGTGTHGTILGEGGFKVIGVDIVQKAVEKGRESGLTCLWFVAKGKNDKGCCNWAR